MTPLVSVIVPAFNSAAYLGAAIQSLLTQTVANIEIVVIDDGSTDRSLAIATKFAEDDRRVRVLSRGSPSGKPACARNLGLREASGKYIAFLDSDDVALPTRFERLLRAMERADATMAFADFQQFDAVPTISSGSGFLKGSQFVKRAADLLTPTGNGEYRCRREFIGFMLSEMIAVSIQTVIISRSLLDTEETWFDESLVGGEDVDLFLRLSPRASLTFVDEVVTLMRVHTASLTAEYTEKCIADGIRVRLKHIDSLGPQLSASEVAAARESISRSLFYLGYDQWCDGDCAAARSAFKRSWLLHPTCSAAAAYLKGYFPRPRLVGALKHMTRRPSR